MHCLKRISTLLLALALSASLLAGCASREDTSSGDSSVASESTSSSPQASSAADSGEKVSSILSDLKPQVKKAFTENDHTVGWLHVPGTPVDDVVLFNPEDETNEYYLRLDFNKNYSFNGVYYADKRSEFGDGTSKNLGTNTCIYGHALTDDNTNDKYNVKFGSLHDFRDPALAKAMPYLLFSTAEEDMAFEVIAVFVSNADNQAVPYNRNDIPQKEFVEMVRNEILPRSKYTYDTEIKDDDKFLTLSTCIYTLDNGKQTGYPNTFYRFGVMGRLVGPDEPLKKEAVFTENKDVIIDATGGKWDNSKYLAEQSKKAS